MNFNSEAFHENRLFSENTESESLKDSELPVELELLDSDSSISVSSWIFASEKPSELGSIITSDNSELAMLSDMADDGDEDKDDEDKDDELDPKPLITSSISLCRDERWCAAAIARISFSRS